MLNFSYQILSFSWKLYSWFWPVFLCVLETASLWTIERGISPSSTEENLWVRNSLFALQENRTPQRQYFPNFLKWFWQARSIFTTRLDCSLPLYLACVLIHCMSEYVTCLVLPQKSLFMLSANWQLVRRMTSILLVSLETIVNCRSGMLVHTFCIRLN